MIYQRHLNRSCIPYGGSSYLQKPMGHPKPVLSEAEGAYRILCLRLVHILFAASCYSSMDARLDTGLADAILDRLMHNAHKLELRGESMRKLMTKLD